MSLGDLFGDFVKAGTVTVPVNVGEAVFALLAIAGAMLSNSTLNSVPRIILPGSPEGKLSLAAKLVIFV